MRLRCVLILCLIAAASSLASAQSHYTFTPVANLSDYGGYFEPATLTNRGDVLFAPALLPAGPGNEGVLWWHGGVLTTIAAGGDPAPGGGIFGYTLSPVQMNDHGDVAFIMSRDGPNNIPDPNGLNAGVYRYNPRTGIVPVMLPGTPAPGGGVFWGSLFIAGINNRGDVYFPGMICTSVALSFAAYPCPDGSPNFISFGVYKADPRGTISPVVLTGDAAPGGSYFDFAHGPATNARGDVAFTGHIYGDGCNPYPFCWDAVFLKSAPSGVLTTIAKYGMASPVSGRTYGAAYSAELNSVGHLTFIADISLAHDFSEPSVFLYTAGTTIAIAKPGDPMPGGGTFAFTGGFSQDVAMNNAGDIVFDATLTDGTQGIYLWRHGVLGLVAKTGTDTGAGVIANVDDFGTGSATTQLSISENGRILFAAKFQGGGGALFVATPR